MCSAYRFRDIDIDVYLSCLMYLKILNWSRPKVKIEYRFPHKIQSNIKVALRWPDTKAIFR